MLTYVKLTDIAYLGMEEKAAKNALIVAHTAVKRATRRAQYHTAPNGLPSDPDLLEALQEAVKAHVEALHEAGMEDALASGGVKTEVGVKSASHNGSSLTYDTSMVDAAKARLLEGALSPVAEAILDEAGLLHGMPGLIRW